MTSVENRLEWNPREHLGVIAVNHEGDDRSLVWVGISEDKESDGFNRYSDKINRTEQFIGD